MGPGGGGLTTAQQDAIGYVGGGILAICLIPQVAKVVMTRSARDISISWSVLYSIGLTLSLAYLILKDAPAAWIPIIFEIGGCLLVLFLKLFYEHTQVGRRYSAAKQQQQQQLVLPLHNSSASFTGAPHGGHGFAALGAAAAAVGSGGDISWRGRAVLGQHQEAPSLLTVPMIDVSTHGGSRHGESRHGSVHGTRPASASPQGLVMQDKQQKVQQDQQLPDKDSRSERQGAPLEVKCTGTSVGSCSSSSISAMQENSRAAGLPQPVAAATDAPPQQQQQQVPPQEPLFASTWSLQHVSPVAVTHPAAGNKQHQHEQ